MKRYVLAALAASLALGRAAAEEFMLTSRDVEPGGAIQAAQVYRGYGCEGGNVSPELTWSDPPAGTRSFAVTVYDPDAPTGSGWWHWVIFDIPADVRRLSAGAGDPGKGLAPLTASSRARTSAPKATEVPARPRGTGPTATCSPSTRSRWPGCASAPRGREPRCPQARAVPWWAAPSTRRGSCSARRRSRLAMDGEPRVSRSRKEVTA
jgi:phosphatidylethanolamine-binding protein (PEBP) family uncharacterized protein